MYLYLITSDLKDETKYTLPLLEQCIDADYGVFDFVGDSCQAYRENTGNCGKYDHGYFKAKSMCCACKGKIQCNHSTEKLNSFSILHSIKVEIIMFLLFEELATTAKNHTSTCPMKANKTCSDTNESTLSYEDSTINVIEKRTDDEVGIKTSTTTQYRIVSDAARN